MPEKWELRSRLRQIGHALKSWAVPGFLLLLVEVLDYIDLAKSIADATGWTVDPIAFLKDWGWLLGTVWIVAVILWAARQPDASERVRAMQRLGNTIVNSMLKFDAFIDAHPITKACEPIAHEAMRELRSAVRGLAVAAVMTVPAERRMEYGAMLADAWADLSEFHRDRPFSIDEVRGLLDAIYDALQKPPSDS